MNRYRSADKDRVLQLEKELYCLLFDRKKALYMNKGIIYLNMNESYDFVNMRVDDMFGTLIVLEDEFLLNSDKVQRLTR